jgi:DNA-binding response OmpR family regulator
MDPNTMKILLVDDDEMQLEFLSFLVQRADFRPIVASDCATAVRLLDEQSPDLLVLDIQLGENDGLQMLETVRRFSDVPIIMLSARDSEEDIERALELGADDYVTKPFPFRELLARIRAVLRRTHYALQPVEPIDLWMRVGPLALNRREHKATLDGLPLALTRTEFRLLQLLMENAGSVVPYCVLLKEVWSYDDPTATDVVRAAVYRLRRKLGETNDQPVIMTLPGIGVVLRRGAQEAEPVRLPNEQLILQPVHLDRTFQAA